MSENTSGDLLKNLRKDRKLSQKELADLAGISQSTLVKYEKGTRKISKGIDTVLSEIFNVDTLLSDQIELVATTVKQLLSFKEKNSLTSKQLAQKIGIDEPLMSRILSGSRKPSKDVQQKIAIFLSNEVKEILVDIKQDDDSFKLPIVDKLAMGERIQNIRKDRGETLEKFGKKFTRPAGKNVVNRWENGLNIPDIERLMNIAYLGKVTVSYILYGDTFRKMLKKGDKIIQFEKLDPFLLGLRLRKIRRDYRMEREDFGKIFSPPITKWSMDKYENGKDIPNSNRIIQYAYIGNISLEYLIYGQSDKC
ncbi:helix-turn-helix transcriptional regulator [Enterococcus faecium]|uniref:helix-turn-helix domain-containing protein n=1 Tax=Enterococcus faecalis TaxID=1351 RepID=UPI0019EB74B0|nr:helix-turn-helix transcriptional regulator [Enterococcus faecalis]EMF0280260.1 helix-turn-helix transcriptional regulator [Enterococcus faecium]EGO8095164.1 helix-turn-helix domain-containing protein [Enterococcus faecalis]EHK9411942.1 helix-turn-helix transcriptional regulator [Enterococcus faecalis]EHQ8833487.1 helix-turn-helix transcriptional regulator [Enterococcus faecalis]EKK5253682.1 helix-turn-helix transcriptional regulator [Enterococcus faecalis]